MSSLPVACEGRVRDSFRFADEPLTECGRGKDPVEAEREESRDCGPRRASPGFLGSHRSPIRSDVRATLRPLGGPLERNVTNGHARE